MNRSLEHARRSAAAVRLDACPVDLGCFSCRIRRAKTNIRPGAQWTSLHCVVFSLSLSSGGRACARWPTTRYLSVQGTEERTPNAAVFVFSVPSVPSIGACPPFSVSCCRRRADRFSNAYAAVRSAVSQATDYSDRLDSTAAAASRSSRRRRHRERSTFGVLPTALITPYSSSVDGYLLIDKRETSGGHGRDWIVFRMAAASTMLASPSTAQDPSSAFLHALMKCYRDQQQQPEVGRRLYFGR